MKTRYVAVQYLTKKGLYEIKALPIPYKAKLTGLVEYRGKKEGEETHYKLHVLWLLQPIEIMKKITRQITGTTNVNTGKIVLGTLTFGFIPPSCNNELFLKKEEISDYFAGFFDKLNEEEEVNKNE